jgi:prevent-host-death family protein
MAPANELGLQTRELGIRELRNGLSRVLAELPTEGRVLITKHGRPIALLITVEESYDYVLAFAEEFAKARLEAREAHSAGKAAELVGD